MNLLHANDRPGLYPQSWYAETATPLDPFTALKGEHQTDICVIGAGYTGLSAALHLAERGYNVMVLEAQRVGFGASGRNGGQVGSGQRISQPELEQMLGPEDAQKLWQIGEAAKAKVKSLIARHKIDCDWRDGVAHADWDPSDVPMSHAEASHLAELYNYDQIAPLDQDGIAALTGTDVFAGGVVDRGAGSLHPLKYALGLARAAAAAGAVIHERSEVVELIPGDRPMISTASGEVRADHVIVACNGYLGRLEPKTAAHIMPINNFIIATDPLGAEFDAVLPGSEAVADSRFVVNYWRMSPDRRLIFGGGESYGPRFPMDIAKLVRRRLLEVYPQMAHVEISHAWGGTLAITRTRLPCFHRPARGVLAIAGYSGHGVALASLAGEIAAETIADQAERFDLMARLPVPRMPGGATLRQPLLVLAMSWAALRDRLGI
ncbi:MAG: FAD-binding oxidoreductase [Pseudomonadota bacterium]